MTTGEMPGPDAYRFWPGGDARGLVTRGDALPVNGALVSFETYVDCNGESVPVFLQLPGEAIEGVEIDRDTLPIVQMDGGYTVSREPNGKYVAESNAPPPSADQPGTSYYEIG